MDNVILHSDLNNFYASVEMVLNPELKGKAIAVAGDPEKRHGIVLAKSMLAKASNVKTGDTLWQAKQKCPDIIFLPPTYKEYSRYSKDVFSIYTRFTDRVESFGLDECWLDVTKSVKLFGNGLEIAKKIKNTIYAETGLTVSIGVSFNKIFAKIGSDLKKPDAITVINKENFKDIIWRLPTNQMLFIGRATSKALTDLNINTIGDLAQTDPSVLHKKFGKIGLKIYECAWGRDKDEVKLYNDIHVPESVGNGTTTSEDMSKFEDAKRVIFALSEVIAYRLRKYRLIASGVSLSMRNNKLNTFIRQEKLDLPTSNAYDIALKAVEILSKHYDFELMPPLRTLTVSTYSLSGEDERVQLNMFAELNQRESDLEVNIDKIRDKYGYTIIKRALNLQTPFTCDSKEIDDNFLPFDKHNFDKDE